MRLLFIGPPGAGKGTQAARIARRLGIAHISTGEMFRHHVTQGTELGSRVERIMAAGDYVPDEVTVAMLEERMADPDAADGFILDGFPRTVNQLEALDRLIGEDGLDRVLILEVDEDELVSRLLSRGRVDDTEDTIRSRFKVYLEQTQPLVDVYTGRGLTVTVDGAGEIEEVTGRILATLSNDAGR